MARKKHPNKEIEAAVCSAEEKGWKYRKVGSSAHAWGRLHCSFQNREGCALSIWSTPRNAENHAKQIVRYIKKCPHKEAEK